MEKYRSLPSSYLEDREVESEEEDEEDEEMEVRRTPSSRGRRRSKGVPMGVPTKHDPDVCGRRNVRNMEKVGEL